MRPESTTQPLRPGDRILHAYNRELGPGLVTETLGDRMTVHFPRTGETLTFASENHPFVPLTLVPGADPESWAESFQENIVERLARLDVEKIGAFRNRLDALSLMQLREAKGLGSFLGGRIELFPHQLHVAETATKSTPVRWLLADEVGLGKTVEACLILNHLLRTGQVASVLVVAPRALVVQWLGELYRKFHQVFVLVDFDRCEDVRREKGPGFNPFDVYEKSVVALEDLVEEPSLARHAAHAQPDLLVVDEAHRLERRLGTAGSREYRAIAPLCEKSEHLLLLSATPLEADAHGFFRLLELLSPQEFDSWERFEEDLASGRARFVRTSCTRRADIGGLPPRVAFPVDLPPYPEREKLELETLSMPASNAVQEAARLDQFARVLSEPLGHEDPRIVWLGKEARRWDKRGEKTLIFVTSRPSLVVLKKELEYHTSRRVAVFHEDLSPAQRDLEVARFAEDDGPNLLISTELGGEGRNFQFAKRLVLFDLPWDPLVVEQRIGRLDRISRKIPVEIVYFRPHEGFGVELVRLYEALGIFEEPLGGLDRVLGHVVDAVREALDGPGGNLDIEAVMRETRQARERIARAVYHHLHANRYRSDLDSGILARIPESLEEQTQKVVLETCEQFGFEIEPKGGAARYYLEFGPESTVEALYGVPAGSRFLGTFDRREAVAKEALDFFASGHPLVEAVLLEFTDGTRGETTLLEIPDGDREGVGVLLVVKERSELSVAAYDLEGELRPDWLEALLDRNRAAFVSPSSWDVPNWGATVRELIPRLKVPGTLKALAGVRLRRG